MATNYDVSHISTLADLRDLANRAKAAATTSNVIEGVKVNGVLLSLVEKIADILIAEGTSNGTIKVNGVDVAVHGLAALAYKAEVSADDLSTALKNLIDSKAAQSDIDTLNGTGEGSIKKAIDDAFNDFATKVSDDNVVNSYKELIDWAASHGSEAAEMAGNITANATAIDNLKKFVGDLPAGATSTTVVGYIAEAIEALSIGDYVTTEALNTKLADYYTKTEVNTELAKKVDKETGKGLSTEDYTTAEKTKLGNISEGANKVEASETNGNIKINGTETTVYTEPSDVIHGTVATSTEVAAMLDEVFGS